VCSLLKNKDCLLQVLVGTDGRPLRKKKPELKELKKIGLSFHHIK